MTLEELAMTPGYSVTPAVAAQFLQCNPYALNVAAKEGRLGLEHCFAGRRLHISKAALLKYCGYQGEVWRPEGSEERSGPGWLINE